MDQREAELYRRQSQGAMDNHQDYVFRGIIPNRRQRNIPAPVPAPPVPATVSPSFMAKIGTLKSTVSATQIRVVWGKFMIEINRAFKS